MLNKTLIYSSNLMYMARNKFVTTLKRKDGMEMLQMVLIIAIAAALGVLFWTFTKGTLFSKFKDEIMNKLNEMFNAG